MGRVPLRLGTGVRISDTVAVDGDELLNAGVYNVLALGALGDGVQDDAPFIQNAINLAQTDRGGVVFLPGGKTYRVASTLVINGPGVGLVGARSLGVNTGTIVKADNLSYDILEVDSVNYATNIENIHFKVAATTGGTGGQNGSRAIFLNNVQNVWIRDVQIANAYNGIYITGGAVELLNCVINPADLADTGRYGVLATGVSGNANATVCINTVVGTTGHTNLYNIDGFIIADGYNTLTLLNCAAVGSGCNRGIWSTINGGSQGAPNFLVVDACWSSDHCRVGIQLDDGAYCYIHGALITSTPVTGTCLYIASTYEGGPVQVSDFNFGAGSGSGIYCAMSGTTSRLLLSNGAIGTLAVGTTAGHGIELAGSAQVTGTNITFYGSQAGTNAVNLDSTFSGTAQFTNLTVKPKSGWQHASILNADAGASGYASLDNFYITGATGSGVKSNTTAGLKIVLSNGYILNPTVSGIEMGGSEDISANNVTIQGFALGGIAMDATATGTMRFSGGYITAGQWGIYAATGATGTYVVSGTQLHNFSSFAIGIVAVVSANSSITNCPGLTPQNNPQTNTGAVPPTLSSGATLTNPFPCDCVCSVFGGTVSAITLNGGATGQTSGMFYVAAAGKLAVTYSVAPTLNWTGV